MIKRLTVISLALLAMSLGQVAPAAAESDADRARELYESGTRQYQSGEYREAAKSLRAAYDLVERPALLYNIAMAHWRAGDHDRAVATFERALKVELPGNLRPQSQARLAGVRAMETAAARAEAISLQPVTRVTTGPGPARSTRPAWGWRGWTGTVATVAGAGLLTGAGVASLRIGAREDELFAAADANDANRLREVREDIERLQAIGPPLLVSGAVLAVVGLGLVVTQIGSGHQESRRQETATIVFGPASGGIVGGLRVTF